jgi:metacaspase-1
MHKPLFAAIACLILSFSVHAQNKYALLIGIGDYDTKVTNWNKLNSVRDIEIIRKTLERQNFPASGIFTVLDQQATKQGITDAMKALTAKVTPNGKDVVYIHVSSHGAQLEDDDATGDETDGLDEAIVTINAKWTEDKAEFKKVESDYLRDDEFGEMIETLRARLGKEGDVVVVMDLCHSGTVTRGELVARGNKAPIVSANFNKPKAKDNLKEFRENSKASRGDNANLATYVVFSAARAEEAAYETYNDEDQKMGTLSYAFTKALESLQSETTYRTLFARIEAIMDLKSNIQHPMQEGNGLDRGFLGGRFVVQTPYIEIERIDEDNNSITIKSGYFAGLDAGSGISFYPSGTTDPSKATPVANGKVASASQFRAVVNMEKNTGKQPKDIWAFVTEPIFKVKPVVVKIDNDQKKSAAGIKVFSNEETAALKTRLKNLKQVNVNGEAADILLVKGENFDSLFIASTGYLFATTQRKTLEENLRLYSKYKYLKQLEVKDSTIKVQVRLGKRVNGKTEFTPLTKTMKGLEFHELDTMIVAVKNNSKFDVYVNILDFEPYGKVNPIFPNKSMSTPIQPSELKIPAGREVIFKNTGIIMRPPYGPEVFKIFVSDMEIDMEGVAREFRARSMMTALEGLMSDVPEVLSRGGDGISLKEAKGVVFNIPFQILPKK